MDAKSCKKLRNQFVCDLCDYTTNRKSSIDKHNLSSKHINRIKLNELENKSCIKELYACSKCKKTYTARNSLLYHAKKCNNVVVAEDNLQDDDSLQDDDNLQDEENIMINIQELPIHTNEDMKQLTSMVFELMKSNNELQKQLFDVCKTNNTTNTIISNNHSNNNTD